MKDLRWGEYRAVVVKREHRWFVGLQAGVSVLASARLLLSQPGWGGVGAGTPQQTRRSLGWAVAKVMVSSRSLLPARPPQN